MEIEGIGVVRGGRFEPSPKIEKRLNPVVITKKQMASPPQSTQPSPSAQPNRSKYGWMAIAVGVVVGVAVLVLMQRESEVDPTPEVVPMVELTPAVAEVVEEPDVVEVVEVAEVVEVVEVVKKSTPTLLETRKAKTTSNSQAVEIFNKTFDERAARPTTKYRVVYGVYTSKANAGRAIVNARELNRDERTVYGVELRDGKYMVTLFENDHFYTSVSYMKRNNSALGDVLWVYDPDKM